MSNMLSDIRNDIELYNMVIRIRISDLSVQTFTLVKEMEMSFVVVSNGMDTRVKKDCGLYKWFRSLSAAREYIRKEAYRRYLVAKNQMSMYEKIWNANQEPIIQKGDGSK